MERASRIINRACNLQIGRRTVGLEDKAKLAVADSKFVTRRQFMSMAGSSVLIATLAYAEKDEAKLGRGGLSLAPGFYPTGHWIAAKQAAIQIYPVQDGSTKSWAPHQFAYWDGSNGIQYRKTVGVSFGAFPYVFVLMSGPSGMTVEASIWNSAWNCMGAGISSGIGPGVAGYGKVLWTPTGPVTGQSNNVWVRVFSQDGTYVDVKWTLNTASDITQTGGVFCFVDNVHGSSSNPGTLASPYDSLTTACGTTFSASKNPGAQIYLRNSGTAYAMPAFADNNLDTTKPYFELGAKSGAAQKPCAILGYPGETVTLDATTAMIALTGQDCLIQDVAANGGIASSPPAGFSAVADYQLITNNGSRQTLDNIAWSNGLYGTSGTNVPAMALTSGAGQAAWLNIFHTGLADLNHESGHPGNNYSGSILYSVTNGLIQYSEAISSSATSDGAWYFKGADEDCCVRGNLAYFSGNVHACDFGQASGGGSGDSQSNESCYNTVINANYMQFPQVSGSGPEWSYRNNLISPSGAPGMTTATPNSNGPWVFDSNAVQVPSPSDAQPPTGTSVQTDGLNIFITNGTSLLNTSGALGVIGTLVSAYAASRGLVGAEIA